jgi:guanylate cyclase
VHVVAPTREQFDRLHGEPNRRALEALIRSGEVPGILAYHQGRPVGWCSVAPRERCPVLDRSPNLKAVDGEPVWSIVCFFIPRQHRRRGLSGHLIRAAVRYALSKGAPAVEAYPLDPRHSAGRPGAAFTGQLDTFFRPASRKWPSAPRGGPSCASDRRPRMEFGELHPLTLAFRSREMEREYWTRRVPRMRGRTVIAVGLVLVLYTAFGLLDPWIVPEIVRQAWLIRGLILALCAALILATRTRLFARAHQLLLLSLPLLGGLGILAIMSASGETGRLLYYVGLILAIMWTLLFADLRFPLALGASVYLVAGYELIALVISPLPLPVVVNNTFFLSGALMMAAFSGYTRERAERVNFRQSLVIGRSGASRKLLLNILPGRSGAAEIQRRHRGPQLREASILFADIVGFTTLSARMGAEETVGLLNRVFSFFDSLVDKYEVEKIRTIGDNYMVVAGVPRPCPDHAAALAAMALEMRDYAATLPLELRIGLASGPVVAGVIGRKKFQYDVWGEAVNTASRMESHGLPGQIQVTAAAHELIRGGFLCRHRGRISVKGIGPMDTWLLLGRREEPA